PVPVEVAPPVPDVVVDVDVGNCPPPPSPDALCVSHPRSAKRTAKSKATRHFIQASRKYKRITLRPTRRRPDERGIHPHPGHPPQGVSTNPTLPARGMLTPHALVLRASTEVALGTWGTD